MTAILKKDITFVKRDKAGKITEAHDHKMVNGTLEKVASDNPELQEFLNPYWARRREEYPDIGDQLDALFKARQGDTIQLDAIDGQIAAVKAKHPKPE